MLLWEEDSCVRSPPTRSACTCDTAQGGLVVQPVLADKSAHVNNMPAISQFCQQRDCHNQPLQHTYHDQYCTHLHTRQMQAGTSDRELV
jgi:hypothetical protein